MLRGPIVLLLAVSMVRSAAALESGSYLCTVEQWAGIAGVHLEGAAAPEAFSDREPYRFRIRAAQVAEGRWQVEDIAYDGADRSDYQWQDDNSTLHAVYLGESNEFHEVGGDGFLRFVDGDWAGRQSFYHAGFEFGGGEDTTLSARWGWCVPEQH